ncbi:hypothetical protein NUU61_008481 [Penicillium alfredii]|uniref:Uncharacterized protein n=1 Tax=Penicillium alfredii TaxID=1506179 RepID=A0A9W9ELB0_9EURO|nr:uncharacterized protein NUU61_008481 [Penicillium alfredii]KAJ5083902.1 hypothetical protein NUU61_008481 [Penicillium alfredii]
MEPGRPCPELSGSDDAQETKSLRITLKLRPPKVQPEEVTVTQDQSPTQPISVDRWPSSHNNRETSTIPTSLRNRGCVLSESEISVLDLGPSLTSPWPQHSNTASANTAARLTPSSTSDPHIDMPLLGAGTVLLPTGSDSDHCETFVDPQLHSEDLESVAVTSETMSFSNENPLWLRHRRRNDVLVTIPPANRFFAYGDLHNLGYGYGHAGFARGHFYIADEPDCEIRSLSVPHSPKSPHPARPVVQRSKTSFGGMDLEFVALRNAEMARMEQSQELFPGIAVDVPPEDGNGGI